MDDDHRIKPDDYSFPGLKISHKTLQTTEVLQTTFLEKEARYKEASTDSTAQSWSVKMG